jgi:Tol biopolymer transport system component
MRERSGALQKVIGDLPQFPMGLAISPDEGHVAVGTGDSRYLDIWLYSTARGTRSRVTHVASDDRLPMWSPSGKQLLFTSNRGGNADVWLKSADGTGEATLELGGPTGEYVRDWSLDGRFLLLCRYDQQTQGDLWYRDRQKGNDSAPAPCVNGPFDEWEGAISPDNRYVAFVSDESGQYEIYVERFPAGGGKVRVSLEGGIYPRWRRDGKELFYITEDGAAFAVPVVSSSDEFTIGEPVQLFRTDRWGDWDVSGDGQYFVLAEPGDPEASPVIRVVQNWFEEFRERQ